MATSFIAAAVPSAVQVSADVSVLQSVAAHRQPVPKVPEPLKSVAQLPPKSAHQPAKEAEADWETF